MAQGPERRREVSSPVIGMVLRFDSKKEKNKEVEEDKVNFDKGAMT